MSDVSRTHLKNGGAAPRAARRPPGKARRPRRPGVFEEGATPPGGMHRRPNAVPIVEMGSSSKENASRHQRRTPRKGQPEHGSVATYFPLLTSLALDA